MITIVTCTYFSRDHHGEERMENCRASLQSWLRLIQYPEIAVHVADDGSDADLWGRFRDYHQGIRITWSQQKRRGIGASLNAGLAQAFANGGLAFYIQDDLLLEQPLDLTFPAWVLNNRPEFGLIKMGLPHPDTEGTALYIPGGHRRESMILDVKPHHYAVSFRPFLAHQRMSQLGNFLEGAAAEWAEKEFNQRYIANPVFKVGQWMPNPWHHQHVVNLGIIEPKGGA